jgi:hypothetical protein
MDKVPVAKASGDCKVIAVKHLYSCGGYWIAIETESGETLRITPAHGAGSVLSKSQAQEALYRVAGRYSPPLAMEWREGG